MVNITEEQREKARRIALSRSSLAAYIEQVRGWRLRDHQIEGITAVDALIKGQLFLPDGRRTNRLLWLAPPGSGKTDSAIEIVEWVIGRETELGRVPQCGYISYSDDVAAARSVAIRNTIEFNEGYHETFPHVTPAKSDGWGQNEWYLERKERGKKDPALRAAGITGGILSYRFPSLIVIDDPHDIKMLGPIEKDRVWRTYSSTIKTRGLIGITPTILISTRWADDDLAGRILKAEDDWYVVHTKALISGDTPEDDRSYWPPETLADGTHFGISVDELHKLHEIEPDTFITQFQAMSPAADAEIFKYWEYGPYPSVESVRGVFFSCDTAYTDKASSSYQCVLQWVWTTDGRVFLVNAYRRKAELPAFMADLRKLHEEAKRVWGKDPLVLVENRASGPAVVQILRQTSTLPIKEVNIKNRDLVNRAAAVSKWFESRRVWLPEKFEGWIEPYVNELRSFPHGNADDQVSATILMLEYLFSRTYGAPPQMHMKLKGW